MAVPTPPHLADRLTQDKNVWVTTIRPDGSPHTTPVWFVFRQDRWWFATAESNRKVSNLRNDNRVSLALEDGTTPVVAEGLARIHASPAPKELADLFVAKYKGWDVNAPENHGVTRLIVEVPVTRWLLTGRAQ